MSGFEGFRDSPQAPFYRAGARSPDDTWNEASRRLEKMIESATAAARHQPIEMTIERACSWHRGIFLSTFPREAGHIRADHEPAEFAIPIEIDGETVSTPMHGALPHSEILTRLRGACETFNTERAALQRRTGTLTAVEGATPSATLYAMILEIHPLHRRQPARRLRRAAGRTRFAGPPDGPLRPRDRPPRRVSGLGNAQRRRAHDRAAGRADRRTGTMMAQRRAHHALSYGT
jgi:hypothetical protein